MSDESGTQSYPLSERYHDRLRTPSGIPFDDITVESVLDGRIQMDDLRVTAEALELQARVAEGCARPQLAENFRRAAELVDVPEERLLEIYRALRPGRASKAGLLALAEQLETRWRATRCANLIRDAANACRS
ncbi:MAG TPA: diol dehydratase small subunit [Terriglobia bacterium]|nr:diol dehydratase small subunit [Terriglobia bacterium]